MTAPCGTGTGYQRHVRRNETPCSPCKAAHNRYMREYRATHERSDDYAREAARARAKTRLAHRYPGVFNALFMEELRANREAAS